MVADGAPPRNRFPPARSPPLAATTAFAWPAVRRGRIALSVGDFGIDRAARRRPIGAVVRNRRTDRRGVVHRRGPIDLPWALIGRQSLGRGHRVAMAVDASRRSDAVTAAVASRAWASVDESPADRATNDLSERNGASLRPAVVLCQRGPNRRSCRCTGRLGTVAEAPPRLDPCESYRIGCGPADASIVDARSRRGAGRLGGAGFGLRRRRSLDARSAAPGRRGPSRFAPVADSASPPTARVTESLVLSTQRCRKVGPAAGVAVATTACNWSTRGKPSFAASIGAVLVTAIRAVGKRR